MRQESKANVVKDGKVQGAVESWEEEGAENQQNQILLKVILCMLISNF